MFGLHWTPEPWLSEYMQSQSKTKKHHKQKINLISRMVHILDAHEKIIIYNPL